MGSTFGSLETGVRALRAHQLALQTTGQNISNADTPGYSRQIAILQATTPYTYPGLNREGSAGQIGTGVEVTEIQRMRDEFIDYQMRDETSLKGRWQMRQKTLEQMEVVFNEPSDTAVSTRLGQFWDSLQELATRSDDSSVRATVRENAIVFTETVKHTYNQLTELQADLDEEVEVFTGKVNTLATQIAALNDVITKVKGTNQAPNDLFDQRELLVQNLADLVDIGVHNDSLGRYTISLGGTLLVAGDKTSRLKVQKDFDNQGMNKVVWEKNGVGATINNGQIQGLIEMRDEELQGYIDSLNDFTSSLIERFNEVHRAGFGMYDSSGNNFFTGTDASDVGVNPLIVENLNIIAGSVDISEGVGLPRGAAGNGENAINLAHVISRELLLGGGSVTLSEYYNGLVAKLGIDAEKANSTTNNQVTLINYLADRQESISGVSMDEEMANMIKFQNAYNASARYVTTIDEMLERLINGVGLVGR